LKIKIEKTLAHFKQNLMDVAVVAAWFLEHCLRLFQMFSIQIFPRQVLFFFISLQNSF